MSNVLRNKSKKRNAPPVRKDEFDIVTRNIGQKLHQIQQAVAQNFQLSKFAASNIAYFVQFLIKKGVVSEEEFSVFTKEQHEKSLVAEEIRGNKEWSREEKIAKAKEKDIPEEWVVEPEAEEKPETKTVVVKPSKANKKDKTKDNGK